TEYCLRPAAGSAARCQTLDGSTPYPIPESGVWTLAIKARDAAGWISSRELTFISYEKTKIDLLEARIKEAMQRFDKGEQLAAMTDLLQFERSRRAFTTERERQVLLPRIKEALMHMVVAVNLQSAWMNPSKSTRCRIIPAASETVVCVENHNGDQALVFRNILDGREIKRYPTIAGDNFQLLIPKSSPVVIFRDSRRTLTRFDWQNNIVSTEEKRIDTWNAIGVSDDGRYVSALLADKFLWLWDWTDATQPKVTRVHEAPGSNNVSIRIGPDARLIFATFATAPGSGLVLIKDERGYHEQSFQDWHDIQFSIAQGLFLARTQFAVSLYRMNDLSLVDQVDYYTDHTSSVFHADWSADGKSIEVLRKYGAGYAFLTFGRASLKNAYRSLTFPVNAQNRDPAHFDLKVVISPDSDKVALISDSGMTLWKLDPKGYKPPTELVAADEKVLSTDYEGMFLGEQGTFSYKSHDQFRSYGLTKGLLNAMNGWARQLIPASSSGVYNITTDAAWGTYDADKDQLITRSYPDGVGLRPPLAFPDERLILSPKTEVGGVALWADGAIVLDSDTGSYQLESSPDGHWAAVVLRDSSPPEVELWNIQQRKIIGRFPGRLCYMDNTGLLLKEPTQGPVRLDFQTMQTAPSPSTGCSYLPGTPFQWNGEAAIVGAGHAIQSVWTHRTLVPAVMETSEANRLYFRREFHGNRFVDLFQDQNVDLWLQVNQHRLPMSASVSDFTVYPDFILTGNPYFGTLTDASELIETKGFGRVRVPGKLVSGTMLSQKTGTAVMPMYFPAEDVTRFIPYDLDRLLHRTCDYLQSKPIKIEGDICLIP
ncbi:MAG: hypothetical protein M3Q07_04075, partial [Pseudobdellovibrionaceae bacterium]|nr:hypothetical protein [Pseudobdellovibrionaceae bacterium]